MWDTIHLQSSSDVRDLCPIRSRRNRILDHPVRSPDHTTAGTQPGPQSWQSGPQFWWLGPRGGRWGPRPCWPRAGTGRGSRRSTGPRPLMARRLLKLWGGNVVYLCCWIIGWRSLNIIQLKASRKGGVWGGHLKSFWSRTSLIRRKQNTGCLVACLSRDFFSIFQSLRSWVTAFRLTYLTPLY